MLAQSSPAPAARHDAPVGPSERGVTQSVQDRVNSTVDVAQPVPWHTHTVRPHTIGMSHTTN